MINKLKKSLLNILQITVLAGLVFSLSVSIIFAQVKKDTPKKLNENITMGSVNQVTSTKLIVDDIKTRSRIETIVDSTTKILGQLKKTIRLADIKPQDMVVVISTPSASATDSAKTASGSAKALKIFVKEASAASKRQAVSGSIESITGTSLKVTHLVHKDRVYNINTNTATIYKSPGIDLPKFANLTVGARIVVVGDPQADGTLIAKYIHIIPAKGNNPFKAPGASSSSSTKKTPTPSPKPATSSASLTLTPTATPSATQ